MPSVSTYIKDPFPGLSHFFGAALSVVALLVLIHLSVGHPASWMIGFSIYGASLIALYLASGFCHSLHVSPAVSQWLNRFDYMAIFLLIAGTCTPICLIALRGPWGWGLLIAEWLAAVVGIGMVLLGHGLSDKARAILYVTMGWVAAVGVLPVIHALSPAEIGWLFAGGIIYSLGAIVFVKDRPHLIPGWFNAHDLWHCMVLAGSGCHFVLMVLMTRE